MTRRILLCAALGLALAGIPACDWTSYFSSGKSDTDQDNTSNQAPAPEPEAKATKVEVGNPLYPPQATADASEAVAAPPGQTIADPIVVPDCRLQVIHKEEVPAQRDGTIKYIMTEAKDGEAIPPDRELLFGEGPNRRRFRRLKENDFIESGQLMALLDDRLARDDLAIKMAKTRAAEADLRAAEKTRDEAQQRYYTQERLAQSHATSAEDVRGAKLLWQKSDMEAVSKKEAVSLAQLEAQSAQTIVDYHQIRASISGQIKTIYKSLGESVKNMEPVFLIRDLSQLRAEGLVEIQNFYRVRQGMKAIVEPTQAQGPLKTFTGHTLDVTGAAVAKDNSPVSCSEDGTVRVWDRATGSERLILRHPTAVRSVACTPSAAEANLCLSGGADGIGRLWDLSGNGEGPMRVLKDQHRGAITCVAFSPDGKFCATGGEDHKVCLWKTDTGSLLYEFIPHSGAVTSLQFTPQCQLMTAGRDNTQKLWSIGERGARLEQTFDHGSGDVPVLGVSPNGRHFLFDQGKALRIRSLPEGRTEGVIQNASGASNFTSFALFSPDGRLIVTSDAAEGRLQLWRAPTATHRRVYEVRQLMSGERARVMTCAAFSPDGTFLVTGSRDHQVILWSAPAQSEIERELTAEIVLVEPAVESNAFRVWAVLPNPDGRLLPGGTATLAIYPTE